MRKPELAMQGAHTRRFVPEFWLTTGLDPKNCKEPGGLLVIPVPALVDPVPQASQLRSQTRWSRDYSPLCLIWVLNPQSPEAFKKKKKSIIGLPLVQWLSLRAPNAEAPVPSLARELDPIEE